MRRTLLLAAALTIVSIGIGWFVMAQTFPSDEDIQQASIEELGKDNPLLATILRQPLVKQFMDETLGAAQDRIQDRSLAESRDSMLLGGASVLVVNVVGVALIVADNKKRSDVDAARAPSAVDAPAA